MKAANDRRPPVRTLRISPGLHNPVLATVCGGKIITAEQLVISGGADWLGRLRRALLNAGIDGARPLIVRERGRGTLCTLLTISDKVSV